MNVFEQTLQSMGFRLTRSRRAVVYVLEQAKFPLCPQEILTAGQTQHAKLGLVTVYRTLNLLVERQLVQRVHRADGCHAYVLSSPGHHHHVLCDTCGCVVEFTGGSDLDRLVDRVESQTGFRIEDHLLQLSGLCPDCCQTRDHTHSTGA